MWPGASCRHCQRKAATRPGRLCRKCFYTPAVRALYPVTCPIGHGPGAGPRPLPAEPTQARPGSPEKIAVLEARALRNEQLFHPLDRRLGRPERPPLPHFLAPHLQPADEPAIVEASEERDDV